MNIWDWLIVAAVAGWIGYLIFGKKKKSGCCGDCASCCGCENGKNGI